MMCGVSATVEEAGLDYDDRCVLLRVLAHGLLSSPHTPPRGT